MQETILLKIRNLVKNAERFENMQFRLLLEEMVMQGGRDAESLVGSLATSEDVDSVTRINIIRIMGYITSSTFLIPLKKILEGDENLNLRKAAIISIAKFNDKRALNMLNIALRRIENPVLADSISTEIGRIKQDNPILGLMPKFLNGVNDPKTFRTTLEVLKKVLNPKDAHTFIYHLKSETPFVGDGAFEVLCWRGDDSVKFSIFDFFKLKLKQVDCIDEEECYSLLHLVTKIEKYITRNPDTINYILKELKDVYKRTKDPGVKDLLINTFGSSPKREVLSILEETYNKEPDRRRQVIETLKGNETGSYILLYMYKKDEDLKQDLTLALLTTQKGSDYIIETFNALSPGYRKLVLDNIDISNYRFFKKLIEGFLVSKDYGEKRYALEKISESRDFNFHTVFFDPKYEKEFLRMHQDFIANIARLCPLKTFTFFIGRVIKVDAARALMRKYFDTDNDFLTAEAVITIPSPDDPVEFIKKVTTFNNKELNVSVLTAFYYLKSFDFNTLTGLQNMLTEFKSIRGPRISPDERGIVNKLNTNLLDINSDIKAIQKGNTNIKHFLDKEFPDFDLLEYILKNHLLSFFTHRNRIFERIKKTFKLTNEIDAFDSIKYMLKRPRMSTYFKDEIKKSSESSNYLLKQDADQLLEIMPKNMRIVLIFKDDLYYCFLKDQLHEILPEAEVTEGPGVEPGDMLITDSASMEKLISENRVNTKRLYVLLKNTSEFEDIKEFKPKAFPPPFSLYKVVKALIQDLYTEEETKPVEEKED